MLADGFVEAEGAGLDGEAGQRAGRGVLLYDSAGELEAERVGGDERARGRRHMSNLSLTIGNVNDRRHEPRLAAPLLSRTHPKRLRPALFATQLLSWNCGRTSVVHRPLRELNAYIDLERRRSAILRKMNAGPTTSPTNPGAVSHNRLFFVAKRVGLQLHMREREGFYLRGKHVWYDRRMSLPRQRAMLAVCIARIQRGSLKPVRKVMARRRHNAA